jgi:hypothetical protein
MARALGLAFASKKFREQAPTDRHLSDQATKSFFAPSAMPPLPKALSGKPSMRRVYCRCPLAISVWDDGYGISVPQKIPDYQREYLRRYSAASTAKAVIDIHVPAKAGITRAVQTVPGCRRRNAPNPPPGLVSYSGSDPAVGPLHLRRPPALQVARTPGLGRRI